METVTAKVTNRTKCLSMIISIHSLCCILNNFQVMSLIPERDFKTCVDRYKGNYRAPSRNGQRLAYQRIGHTYSARQVSTSSLISVKRRLRDSSRRLEKSTRSTSSAMTNLLLTTFRAGLTQQTNKIKFIPFQELENFRSFLQFSNS